MNTSRRNILLMVLMFIASGLAGLFTPTHRMAEEGISINLETMIPNTFGDWKLDESNAHMMVNPDVKAELDIIYSQTLSRTYLNNKGDRIMLSIAFGGDQGRTMQVHRPEVCYAAQGFQIKNIFKDTINTGGGRLPVMKLLATQGQRIEPITYWVMIGNTPVRGNLEQGFARLKYSLNGIVPYGLLIRVSTISANESQSYLLEEQFLNDMLTTLPVNTQKLMIGKS